MFFILSKIFWTLAQPLNAICLLAASGLIFRMKWPKAGTKMVVVAVCLLLICGMLPVGPVLMVWLERQYPATEAPTNVDGIIVLGGAFESNLSRKSEKLSANSDIGRIFCAVELTKINPSARLAFTGGSGDILNPETLEGQDIRQFINLIDFKHRNILFEEKSRNTFENAVYSKEMLNPQNDENWVLVTSAYHMPRSVSVFQKLDWNVTAYSCGHKTTGKYGEIFTQLPSVTGNFTMLNIAIKEIIGSVIYYVTGKSAFLLVPAQVTLPHGKNH